MNSFKGQLRRDHDLTPTKSTWDKNNVDFGQAQRSKYEKSELSYYQSEVSHPIYDQISEKSRGHDLSQLYNANIPVRVKSFEREDYHTTLRFQISTKNDKNINMIDINLTDDRNPKFLWKFIVRETEFMTLKNEQKLKVDYSTFPEMVEDHLSLCQSEKEVHPQDNASYFHLLFDMKKNGEGVLSILESNKYKESVHLYLLFRMSNDEQVKEYLSHKLMKAKEENESKSAEISKLQEILTARMATIETIKIETRDEIEGLKRELDGLKNEEQKKYNQLKEKYLNDENKMRKETEIERKETIREKDKEIMELKEKLFELQKNYNEIKEKHFNLEGVERELKMKLSACEKEAGYYKEQLEDLQRKEKEQNEKRYMNEKTITELTFKVESLRSELEDKKSIISTYTELKSNSNNQIDILNEKNKDYKKQVEKMENKIGDLENELSKMNNAYKEMNEKHDKKKDKLTERNEIIKDQEKEITDMKKNFDEQRKRESNLLREKEDLLSQLGEKDSILKTKQNQIEHCEMQLKGSNELVMTLQRQLNEKSSVRGNYYNSGFTSGHPQYSSFTPTTYPQTTYSEAGSSVASKIESRIDPVIKRYTADEQRPKSPILNRLNQQKEPEDEEISNIAGMKPKPIKFKNNKTILEQ